MAKNYHKVSFKGFEQEYVNKADKIVRQHAYEFQNLMRIVFPVDTGHAQGGWWQNPKKIEPMSYSLTNNVRYASILWDGRKPDEKGIIRGSNQMPDGGRIYQDATLQRMYNDISRIRIK